MRPTRAQWESWSNQARLLATAANNLRNEMLLAAVDCEQPLSDGLLDFIGKFAAHLTDAGVFSLKINPFRHPAGKIYQIKNTSNQ